MNNSIRKYYLKLSDNLKEKYIDFTGDKNNLLFLFYNKKNENEQIEKYARILTFWINENIIFDNVNPYDEILLSINKRDDLFKKRVLDRVNQLIDDKRNKEIESIRENLKIVSKFAELYYSAAKNNISEENKKILIDPKNWLFKQDKMRDIWEIYENKLKIMGLYSDVLLNNPFEKYMKYMYDNYPPGYTEECKKRTDDLGIIDSSEIYYELTKK